ncbi:MAG: HAD-IC family P-type ATPase [Halobacteriota archaeon]
MLVGTHTHIIGVIGLKDRIRDASAGTLRALTARGIKTVMLTGDNERAGAAIASELPLSECYAELLPEDKVRHVDELATAYKHVAMIGDGVNDAPAMARAHVSIAMGTAGDVAIETADIALMHDDLSKVTYLIDLSKKTMSVVRENVIAAILIKGSFAVLAFPGFISLWLAVGVGDMGLSLAVIQCIANRQQAIMGTRCYRRAGGVSVCIRECCAIASASGRLLRVYSLTALSASRDLLLSSAHDDGVTCALRHRSR